MTLDCIHCDKFIVNLPETGSDDTDNFFHKFDQLPENLKENINRLGLEQLSIITSGLDRSAFEQNTKIKSFSFYMGNESMKMAQNSFIEGENCWQYFECRSCMKVIGFILKFSNSNDEEFVSKHLNKIILVKDFAHQSLYKGDLLL